MKEIAKALSNELNHLFVYQQNHPRSFSLISDPYALHFLEDLRKPRWQISGEYPRYSNNMVYQLSVAEEQDVGPLPCITVSQSRSATAIAKDIHRRLWKSYVSHYAIAVERVTHYNALLARQEGQKKLLMTLDNTHQLRDTIYGTSGETYWKARVELSGKVDLELKDLDIEQVHEILSLLK